LSWTKANKQDGVYKHEPLFERERFKEGKLNSRGRPQAVEIRQAQRILGQLSLAAAVLLLVGVWQREFLSDIYMKNQLTEVGWIINGGIVLLFGAAIVRLIQCFLRYDREERAINRFIANAHKGAELGEGIGRDTIISARYRIVRELHDRRSPINHSALAATLLAEESGQSSLPKFVHNVLILSGVFGTIVSLSIALLGASDMFASSEELDSLGLVMHGMSTALSTTMTAILAYFFLGYFYLRLMDSQTQIVGRIEQATTTILLPRFQVQQETLLEDFSDIIRAAAALVKRLDASQSQYAATANELSEVLKAYRDEMRKHSTSLSEITDLLRDGFRLRETRE